MASATKEAESRGGLWWRGLFCGAVAGLVVGLIDGLLALQAGNEIVHGSDLLRVMGFYAACFIPCGLIASVLARWFVWPRRATALFAAGGAALFFVGAWLNVHHLPDFTAALSIAVDIGLLVLGYVWFRWSYQGPGDDEVRWWRWLTAGAVALLVGTVLGFVESDRDGPDVEARLARGREKLNVLVYMVDTLRADALGCYGYGKPTSPEIDAFAADATLFEDCRSPTSWTKPAVASLFTSLYPTAHACVQQREVLAPEAETLAEVFRAAGWRTGAFSENIFVAPEFGLGQGFSKFDRVRPSVIANGTLLGKVLFMLRVMSLHGTLFGEGGHGGIGVQPLLEEGVLPWIDEQGDKPWFAYVHSMEPHLPYDPLREDAEAMGFPVGEAYGAPPKYNGVLPFEVAPDPGEPLRTKLRAQYDGEVRDASRWFGRTLDALRERGLLEKTVVVFVSDHGEEFRDRGGWTHGHSLHREVVQVPLIMRVPDAWGAGAAAARGRRVKGLASLLDVFPTLMAVTGLRHAKGSGRSHAGQSLLENLVPEEDKGPRTAVASGRALLGEVTMGPVRLRSVRDGRWLYVRADSPLKSAAALYDAVSDEDERRDRSDSEALTLSGLESRLAQLFDALEDVAMTSSVRELDAETRRRLESLGYTKGGK